MVNRSDQKQPSTTPSEASSEASGPNEILAHQDVALVSGKSSDGQGLTILRSRQGRLEAGVVRPLAPGKPIQGEVVRLKPRKALPVLCDVETILESPVSKREAAGQGDAEATSSKPAKNGPPQVASDAYRKNWDAIYRRDKKHQLLN